MTQGVHVVAAFIAAEIHEYALTDHTRLAMDDAGRITFVLHATSDHIGEFELQLKLAQ